MDWKAFWGGLIGAAEEQDQMSADEGTTAQPAVPPQAAAAPPPPGAQARAESAESAEVARLRAEVAAMQQRERQSQAQAWAAGHVAGRRLLPAEQDRAVALYAQALADDASHPLGEGARAATLDALISQRPALSALFGEQIGADTRGLTLLPLTRDGASEALEQDRESARRFAAQTNTKGGR